MSDHENPQTEPSAPTDPMSPLPTDPSDAPASAPSPQPPSAEAEVTTTAPRKVKKIIKKKKRPARAQVDISFLGDEPPPQTGTTWNIWYNKWSGGDREDKYLSKTLAKGRCIIGTDSGFTQADSVPGSFFCLYFARGICWKGVDCEFLHRLPGTCDIYNPNQDCFGREKFSDYRDDMGGVGSFMRQNRTI